MKIVVDLNDPADVEQALALLNGEQPEYVAPEAPAAPARPAPGRPAAPAGRPAPGGARPSAPAGRGAPAAGRPAPGRAPASAPAPSEPAGGVSKEELAAAVQAYAKANGPAAAKAAFADYSAAIGATVTMISHISPDDYDNAIQYFPA